MMEGEGGKQRLTRTQAKGQGLERVPTGEKASMAYGRSLGKPGGAAGEEVAEDRIVTDPRIGDWGRAGCVQVGRNLLHRPISVFGTERCGPIEPDEANGIAHGEGMMERAGGQVWGQKGSGRPESSQGQLVDDGVDSIGQLEADHISRRNALTLPVPCSAVHGRVQFAIAQRLPMGPQGRRTGPSACLHRQQATHAPEYTGGRIEGESRTGHDCAAPKKAFFDGVFQSGSAREQSVHMEWIPRRTRGLYAEHQTRRSP